MGVVAKEIKTMSQESILAFENAGEVVIANHCLKLTDIKVLTLIEQGIKCYVRYLICIKNNKYICQDVEDCSHIGLTYKTESNYNLILILSLILI